VLDADEEIIIRAELASQSVIEKHRAEWQRAGFWKRLWLRRKIKSEMLREIRKITPCRDVRFSAELMEPQNYEQGGSRATNPPRVPM
jgi:hypothetical protein